MEYQRGDTQDHTGVNQHSEATGRLENLPDEMIHHIVTFAESSTLFKLCLTNRRLNRIAMPVLYQNLHITYPCPSSTWEDCPNLRCLGTLRDRPELRSCIKTILHTVSGVWGHQSCDHPGPVLMRHFAELLGLDHQVFTEIPGWVREDRFVTLLAFLSPNLEFLASRRARSTWGWEPYTNSVLLEQISRSAVGISTIHRFDKLRFLHVEAGSAFCIPNQHAFPLVLLPRLEHLTLGGWGHVATSDSDGSESDDDDRNGGSMIDRNDSTVYGQPWKWPVRTSLISELSLRYPKTSSKSACNMILACKALTKFSCDRASEFSRWGNKKIYAHIASALHEHHHTLRDISINEAWSLLYESIHGRIIDLSHMTVLTHLRVPWGLICFPGQKSLCNFLPRSIQTLTIEVATHTFSNFGLQDLVSSLEILHPIVDTKLPSLRLVHVLWRESRWATHSLPFMTNARNLFEHTSVRFDITLAFESSTYLSIVILNLRNLTSVQ